MHGTRFFQIMGILTVLAAIIIAAIILLPNDQKKTVVVYTSVDQVYSEPVFRDFENTTGIKVLAVYDVEATKTTGLVNRLIAEKHYPQADVFWSGEFGQTILLKNEGILEQYYSPSVLTIPAQFHDPDGYWSGFGGRARVLIVNTNRLTREAYPDSVFDMVSPVYPGNSVGIAYPMFGTTATHATALYSVLGQDKARSFFSDLNTRGVRVVDGNSVVRDLVAQGQLAFGLTDTDDACGSVKKGDPVVIIIPDQKDGEIGALIIPNTVALISRSPHPDEAKVFIDYVLDQRTEESLLTSGWIQIPSREMNISQSCLNMTGIKPMNVNYQDVYTEIQTTKAEVTDIFIR